MIKDFKIGVLGAGISGLSVAKLLNTKYDVEVLEAESEIGGIAKIKNVNGIPYHLTGGHCFNSKHKEVLEFVFNNILPKNNWHLVNRKASVLFENHLVPYPIEYAIKDIYNFDKSLAINITKDLINAPEQASFNNLDEWFRNKFGNTLAEKYFIPYNKKVWNKAPSEMSYHWVKDKLPIVSKESFIKNFFESETDKMPHHCFYYPKDNHLNTFIKALSENLNITLNYQVNKISYDVISKKWLINDDKEFDLIISTLPLNIIPSLISGCPSNILEEAKKLKFNNVTTMLWESEETDNTWTYIPQENSIFHRYIHINNFNNSKKNYTITEAIGSKTYDEMQKNGKRDKFLIKPVDFHISKHAYVVFDHHYESSKNIVKDYLANSNIYTLGRFGEWEYYNMDICIKRSLELFDLISQKFS